VFVVSNSCTRYFIKNLLPSSECSLFVSRSLPSNGCTHYNMNAIDCFLYLKMEMLEKTSVHNSQLPFRLRGLQLTVKFLTWSGCMFALIFELLDFGSMEHPQCYTKCLEGFNGSEVSFESEKGKGLDQYVTCSFEFGQGRGPDRYQS
jgi:hypothetical protein